MIATPRLVLALMATDAGVTAAALIQSGVSPESYPVIVPIVNSVLILAIGVWLLKSHLSFRDATIRQAEVDRQAARDLTQGLKEALVTSSDARHRENVDRFLELTTLLRELTTVLYGARGQGGLLGDKQRNQDRRHELTQDVTILYGLIREQALFLTLVGETLKLPFRPTPVERPHRRRGETEDG